jgi:hypothetical protein
MRNLFGLAIRTRRRHTADKPNEHPKTANQQNENPQLFPKLFKTNHPISP